MFRLNNFMQRTIFIISLFILGMSQVFAAASNCQPTVQGNQINISIIFDITNATASISPGTTLASLQSNFIGLSCDFTGPDNNIYFKSAVSEDIKNKLIENGVEIFQRYDVSSVSVEQNITLSTVPDILLGSWSQPDVGTEKAFGIRYTFTVKKGVAALKPFDTGTFLLGFHVNEQGQNIGAPIYARFVGNLTLLCPTPQVSIVASNGGSVNFGTIKPQDMYANNTVSRSFSLKMEVLPECQTGLNIAVRFEPNSNLVLDNKNLDMGNGLQMLLNNSSGDIDYNQPYFVGELLPFTPVNQSYTATLSHIPGRDIISGPFSKTIRVVVSY